MGKISEEDKTTANLVSGRIPTLTEFVEAHFPVGFKISDVQRRSLERIVKDAEENKKIKLDQKRPDKNRKV